ncbi:MAG: hypothetical protein RLZZ407_2020 [Pseudomonadota bacterium]
MPRSIFMSLLLLFVTSGCANDEPEWANITPSVEQIQRLEGKLRNEDCIGDLSEWERRYQFWTDVSRRSATYGKTYNNLIVFNLRKGSENYPIEPVQSVLSSYPSLSFEIDDRPGHTARGKFNTASGELTLEHCHFERGDS